MSASDNGLEISQDRYDFCQSQLEQCADRLDAINEPEEDKDIFYGSMSGSLSSLCYAASPERIRTSRKTVQFS